MNVLVLLFHKRQTQYEVLKTLLNQSEKVSPAKEENSDPHIVTYTKVYTCIAHQR